MLRFINGQLWLVIDGYRRLFLTTAVIISSFASMVKSSVSMPLGCEAVFIVLRPPG